MPLWKGSSETPSPFLRVQGEVCNPEEGSYSTMWTLWSQISSLQNCEKYIPLVCELPSLWNFVTAAQTNQDSWYLLNKVLIIFFESYQSAPVFFEQLLKTITFTIVTPHAIRKFLSLSANQ